MQFLIDGHRDRVSFRAEQWPSGVAGQLLTPLTRYRRGSDTFAIDNGAFSRFNKNSFVSLLRREESVKQNALFVAVPDRIGSHRETLLLWEELNHLCDGWKKAFVAQDGYSGMPSGAGALFIGGTDAFKDSSDALCAVADALSLGKHVHIGRVNTPVRFIRYHEAGAHTCDGSGVSRYDHMLPRIREALNARFS